MDGRPRRRDQGGQALNPGRPAVPARRIDALVAAWRAQGRTQVEARHRPSERRAPSATGLTGPELDRLASAVLRLQRGLTGERSLIGSSYMDDADALGAYLLYYWPVSYAQAARVFLLSGTAARTCLDLGSGPGPVAAAAADLLGAEAFLVDSSERALSLAARLLPGAAVHRADLESPDAIPRARRFDLVTFGHSLNELAAGHPDRVERRAAVVERAATALTEGGRLVFMDPATLGSSRDALALRDLLVGRGWRVTAPCTLAGACPALAAGSAHTCHDDSPWDMPPIVDALAARAGLDRGSIKMAWFSLTPPRPAGTELDQGERIPGTELNPDERTPGTEPDSITESGSPYRVVSEPMLNKAGRVRYLICGPEGRFPLSARQGDPTATATGFFRLGRYDLIRVERPELRENGWGIAPDTRIINLG